MTPTKKMRVFLFDQIVIFADIVKKATAVGQPDYIYKGHIQVFISFSYLPAGFYNHENILLGQ